ncbi:hydroxymethylglutaryl-CoA lyase [Desulforhopalus singaporensis]|uniref:Hydroxymethylglutaryl-CoA lyase n=1 Tax=Desulforhopalus singaporensis TaxID=91360 RepID=A0A1H0KMC7_9BACT|nr:hydroxymethylglutaryl-CoA lyase [Desulforhopalus singaporensis]SDO57127.1 hydroxymethylglutaryl-CoA lyase [Desulforhopalus singaporensis]
MNDPDAIVLEDETLRDGLQVEKRVFSLEEKLELYRSLAAAGVKRIQVGSFVHPRLVPQMANTDQLIREITARGGGSETELSALILNARGLERALDCGIGHLSMSVSVSDTHSRKNAGKSAEEALGAMTSLITGAIDRGMEVRAGIQCAFGCVYEGKIAVQSVEEAARRFVDAGAREINLADTTGMASPAGVADLVARISTRFPEVSISLHLHDTRGLGLANMYAGYLAGVRTFDVCAGGLGGCPFVKGAAGNVPTEDAVNMFSLLGLDTGIDIEAICTTVAALEKILTRRLPGRMSMVLASGKQNGC